MHNIEIPAEAATKLEEIQNKYDIFFTVHNKHISDYFELNFEPYATLTLKREQQSAFHLD